MTEIRQLNSNDLGNSMAEYVRRSGIVLDYLPNLAEAFGCPRSV